MSDDPVKLSFMFEQKMACGEIDHYFNPSTGKGCICGAVQFRELPSGALPVVATVINSTEGPSLEVDWVKPGGLL